MYDSDKAELRIKFIERVCTHVKGELAGQKFILEEWQKEFIRELYGTLNEDGTRQYRTAYVQIPRKNGKSNLSAALALAELFVGAEKGAEIYC